MRIRTINKECFNLDDFRIGNLYKIKTKEFEEIALLINMDSEQLTFVKHYDSKYNTIANIHISRIEYYDVEIYKSFDVWVKEVVR